MLILLSYFLISLSFLSLFSMGSRVPNSPFPIPSSGLNASASLFLIDPSNLSPDDSLTLATLQGLLSRDTPTIYRTAPHSPYDLWRAELESLWGIVFDSTTFAGGNVWGAVSYFYTKKQVNGYVLANLTDGSVNAAVALCAIHNGTIVVTSSNVAQAKQIGLIQIDDVRGRDLTWVLANYQLSSFSNRVTLIQNPEKTGMSDWAIATRALTWYVDDNANATNGPAAEIWGAMSPPFFALGWGPDELNTVWAASRAGGGVIASDWAMDLDILSAYDIPSFASQVNDIPLLKESPSPPQRHTAAFLMSDGDNVQWLLGGFANDGKYWNSSDRGSVPMGWTISASLADLAPSALNYFYRTSTVNDELIMGLSGASYFYTDIAEASGHLKDTAALSLGYAKKAGFSYANVMTAASTALTPSSADVMLPIDGPLKGLFHYQYSDYSGDHGAITFSPTANLPIIGARFNLWGNGTSGQGNDFKNVYEAALTLSLSSRDPTVSNGYSLIVVHAWSHNVSDALSVMNLCEKLAPGGVDFVTPAQLVQRVAANLIH